MAVTTDAMDALRLVRAHDAVTPWELALDASFTDLREAQIRHQRAAATVNGATTFLLVAGTCVFVLIASRSDMPTATVIVLLVVLSRLANRFLGVAQLIPGLAMSLVALADIEELRRSAEAHVEVPGSPAHATIQVTPVGAPLVALCGVTYSYPDGTLAVSDLDLKIPTGHVTVLVGPTGAGKSTIVDLVLGLLVPTAGEVLVAGTPLTTGLLPAWRADLGYVPQDTALLPGTLRENLIWSSGPAGVDDDACWAALDDAAATFAHRLPDGLDTPLGDRGVRLSGGERQRVALARAMIRRPRLLILDEATSALDYDTEADVLATVRALCPETTVLLVTHRISAIASSDCVAKVHAPG
jgi:ATP-binding cassette subfamily C protein